MTPLLPCKHHVRAPSLSAAWTSDIDVIQQSIPYPAGLVFHQRKHARESGLVPAVESLKNTKLPEIPAAKPATVQITSEAKRPAVSLMDPAAWPQSAQPVWHTVASLLRNCAGLVVECCDVVVR